MSGERLRYSSNSVLRVCSLALAALQILTLPAYALAPNSIFDGPSRKRDAASQRKSPSLQWDIGIRHLLRYTRADLPDALKRIWVHRPSRQYGSTRAYRYYPEPDAMEVLNSTWGGKKMHRQRHFLLAATDEDGLLVPYAIIRENRRSKSVRAYFLIDDLVAPPAFEPNLLLQEYLVHRKRKQHEVYEPLVQSKDVADIKISYDKPRFKDSAGTKYFGLEKNLEYVHTRPDGSMQRIGVFCNHGEAEAYFRYLHGQWYFRSKKPVSLWHFDGHADDLSNGAQKPLLARDTFAACYADTMVTCGITNFLAQSVLNGVVDVRQWYFKNTFDGCNYRELMRWAGPHYPGEPMHFDHAPTEGRLLPDAELFARDMDIVDVDLDIFHELKDPVEIASCLRYMVKLARPARVVTFITSPGWVDQELAALYAKILVEMLQGSITDEKLDAYAVEMLASMDRVAEEARQRAEKSEKGKGEYLFKEFHESAPDRKAKVHEEIRAALLAGDQDIALRGIPKNPSVHFYHGHENLAQLKRDLRRQWEREYKAFARVLEHSLRAQALGIKLFGRSRSMTTAQAIRMARRLVDPPHAFNTFFRRENPLEFAIFKIAWHLTSGRSENPTELLQTMLDLLQNRSLSIELRHNILGFFSVFGTETGLYDFPYQFKYLHNWEILNWKTRLTNIQGEFTAAERRDAVQRAARGRNFSVFDLVSILNIDGGGVVTVQRKDGTYDVFGYATGNQESTESYAQQLLEGKFAVADLAQAARARRLRDQFEGMARQAAPVTRDLEDPFIQSLLQDLTTHTPIHRALWENYFLYEGFARVAQIYGKVTFHKIGQFRGGQTRANIAGQKKRVLEYFEYNPGLEEALRQSLREGKPLPFVSPARARALIRAIYGQQDPTAMLIIDEKPVEVFGVAMEGVKESYFKSKTARGQKSLATGIKHKRGKFMLWARHAPGIGYVLETSMKAKKQDAVCTAGVIGKDGHYGGLEAIPGYWAESFRRSVNDRDRFVPLGRWLTALRLILPAKNPLAALPVAGSREEAAAMEHFRFCARKVEERILTLVREGIRYPVDSGSEQPGDAVGEMYHASRMGWSLEMDKFVRGKLQHQYAKRIDRRGDIVPLKRIPDHWAPLFEQSSKTRSAMPATLWHNAFRLMFDASDPGRGLVLRRRHGHVDMLRDFYIQEKDVGRDLFRGMTARGERVISSGSRHRGDVQAHVQRIHGKGYLIDSEKRVPGMGRFFTFGLIHAGGEYVEPDGIPSNWRHSLHHSLVPDGESVPDGKWQTLVKKISEQKRLQQPLLFIRNGPRRVSLKGFRFVISDAPHRFFLPEGSFGRIPMYSGSAKPGALAVTALYDYDANRYIFRQQKNVGGKVITSYRAFQDNGGKRTFALVWQGYSEAQQDAMFMGLMPVWVGMHGLPRRANPVDAAL